jgi:uncharacterized membrane protein
MMPGRILCYVLMIIQWVVVYQSEQNDQFRDQRACALYLCYAHLSVRLCLHLLWTLCLLPCLAATPLKLIIRQIQPTSIPQAPQG